MIDWSFQMEDMLLVWTIQLIYYSVLNESRDRGDCRKCK